MHITMTQHDLFWVLGEQSLGPLEFYFAKALRKNGKNTDYINIHTLYPAQWKSISGYSHRFPRKIDNLIQNKYFTVINEKIIQRYKTDKPHCIFIYNDCRILPETLNYFKSQGTKVIVFLGDDPNYLFPAKKTFLITVMNADSVIVPDTGWIEGLKMLGVKNIIFSPVGTDTEVFFKMNPAEKDLSKFSSDIIFIGTGYYLNSWGIKRSSVLNELSGMNFKLFGDNQWLELFQYFPELKKHFINEQLTSEIVNIACNCSNIYPVTVNHGVVNGVSTRVFDCIASGIFVLAEYKKDFDYLFPDGDVVCFKTKSELKDKAEYFLKNEKERNDIIANAREKVIRKFTIENLVKDILEQI